MKVHSPDNLQVHVPTEDGYKDHLHFIHQSKTRGMLLFEGEMRIHTSPCGNSCCYAPACCKQLAACPLVAPSDYIKKDLERAAYVRVYENQIEWNEPRYVLKEDGDAAACTCAAILLGLAVDLVGIFIGGQMHGHRVRKFILGSSNSTPAMAGMACLNCICFLQLMFDKTKDRVDDNVHVVWMDDMSLDDVHPTNYLCCLKKDQVTFAGKKMKFLCCVRNDISRTPPVLKTRSPKDGEQLIEAIKKARARVVDIRKTGIYEGPVSEIMSRDKCEA